MHQVIIRTALLLAGLTALDAAAGGRGNPAPAAPLIMKTVVDEKDKVLVISGRNFGVTPPTVLLADHMLHVRQFSESQIMAQLPVNLTSGTYGVSVTTTGENKIRSNLFSAMLLDNEAREISEKKIK